MLSCIRNRFSLYIYSELYIRTRYRTKASYFNEMKFLSEKRHLRICCFVTVRSKSPSLQDKGKAYFYITFSITSYTVVNIQDSTYNVSSLFDCKNKHNRVVETHYVASILLLLDTDAMVTRFPLN